MMRIVEYQPQHREAAIELMAALQDHERAMSPDRTPGAAMAEPHFDYLLGLCSAQQGRVFVAAEAGKVIGFVLVFIDAEDAGDRHLEPQFRRFGWVSDLVVDRWHRRAGVARALMEAAEMHCASLGVVSVRVAALHPNDAARRFYEALGYRPYELIYSKGV